MKNRATAWMEDVVLINIGMTGIEFECCLNDYQLLLFVPANRLLLKKNKKNCSLFCFILFTAFWSVSSIT